MPWRLLEEKSRDVFRNLALEEAIARENARSQEKINTLRFWRSDSAVVIGRFQCVHKEVNLAYCEQKGIAIARRFTGGGTVFHDAGNLNFSLCLDQNEPYVNRTLNELYWNFIGGIAAGLRQIGIPVTYDSYRACLRVNGRKVSGTAGWIKQGVSFVHGTLLIDADLSVLSQALRVPPNQPEYLRDNRRIRCLESRKDTVTSIRDEIKSRPSDGAIKRAIISGLENISGKVIAPGTLSQEEKESAESLYQTRYSQSEWNLGTPVSESK